MARTGLEKSEVRKARDSLLAQGVHPTLDAIRVALGNTGSKSTIHKFLKELDDEERGDSKRPISDTLQDLVSRLAERLESEANLRVNEVKADYEAVVKALQAETIARHTAEQQVSNMKERLSENEAHWQAEIRLAQQNLAAKQSDITQLNQDCTRLTTELSHARKALVEQQSHATEIAQKLAALQSMRQQHQMLDLDIADKTVYNGELQFRAR
jgi:chromosome segregation ATPase